ncbi:MAG: hypothetical protein QXP80_02170 [Zestosphaera sp.]
MKYPVKWMILTGLTLWLLTVIMSVNVIITWTTVRHAFVVGLDLLVVFYMFLLALPTIAYKKLKIELSSLKYLLLWVTSLSVIFGSAWYYSLSWGILTSEALLNIVKFSITFSIIFTMVSIPASIYVYRRRRKDAWDLIWKVLEKRK